MRWSVSREGEVGPAVVNALGFEPAVLPCWVQRGDAVEVVGLSRRGPTVVVLRDAGEGFVLVSSDAHPQAMGFAGPLRVRALVWVR